MNEFVKRRLGDGWMQLLRYFVVGGVAFAVDFGLLWLLTACGVHYLISAAIAFCAGLTVNYALSVSWVFETRAMESRVAEFVFFAVIGVLGLGLNEVVMWTVAEVLGGHYLVAKAVSAAVVFFWNFTARKYLLFNGKGQR